MALTSAELRAFINKNFLSEVPVNNIIYTPDPAADTETDLFLPAKTPSMHDIVRPNGKPPAMAEYKYLDDVILSNNLVLFPRNLAETYTIHLCLFSINTDLHTPFLQFMFSKIDSIYQLPCAELDMATIQKSTSAESIQPKPDTEGSVDSDDDDDDDEYDESSGVDAEFLSQCSDLLEKTLSIPDMDIHSLYRGFLEDDQNANQLYVFFDCTGLNIETHSDKFQTGEYIMAIVDELNTGRINNVEISSDVLQIFNNNPFTKIINSASGEPVPGPIISYLCTKNEDETYANEYYSAENGYENISLIVPVVTHAKFDDIYMFSKSPLTGEYNNIKRFALFYDETEDVVENMDNESEEESVEEESVEEESVEEESGEEESGEEESVKSVEEGEEESVEESGEEESVEESGEEESVEEEGEEESVEESGEEESGEEESGEEESGEEESGEEESGEEESGEEESGEEESGEEESVEEESVEEESSEEKSVEEGDEESSEESGEDESAEEDEEESSEESSGEESWSGTESGSESSSVSGSSDESSITELELAENTVFTFTENEQTYYGTYSLESFTEL
jgi:hypothetical protein